MRGRSCAKASNFGSGMQEMIPDEAHALHSSENVPVL